MGGNCRMITYENGVFALQGEGFTCLLRVNQWNLLEQLYFGWTVVIHSDLDDFNSQPAGNARRKIACGVIYKA